MPSPSSYNPNTEIPDLSNQVIFITGGTGGCGHECVLQLAKHNPAHILFSGRSESKARELIEATNAASPNVKVTFVPMDMTSLATIKSALEVLELERMDLIICTAGVMGSDAGQTKDGYEVDFGINHVANALVIKWFLPLLEATHKAHNTIPRVITLTSVAAVAWPTFAIIDFESVKKHPQERFYQILSRQFRYGQSKRANILYGRALTKHHPWLVTAAVHPGFQKTELLTNMPMGHQMFLGALAFGQWLSPTEFAANALWAATSKDVKSGEFYFPVGDLKGTSMSGIRNEEVMEKLWEWTDAELEKWLVRS